MGGPTKEERMNIDTCKVCGEEESANPAFAGTHKYGPVIHGGFVSSRTLAERAANLGQSYGKSAGSWVTDGKTDDATYRELLRMIEDGDPAFEIPAPFSGEWADGLRLEDIYEELDAVPTPASMLDEVADAFEDGYYMGYAGEIERVCRYQLDPTATS